MKKFKIGDKVKHEIFGKGKIVYIKHNEIPYLVEFENKHPFLHDGDGRGKVDHCWWCEESGLEIVEFTKANLQIGDKLTLRNGEVGYYEDKMSIGGLCENQIKEDLTNDGSMGKELDIIKVERPTYTTMYEREVEVKEMTIEEISKELGYEVKVVKGNTHD